MIAVSSLLRSVLYPAMSRANMFSRQIGAGEVCVLTYHGVLPEGSAPGSSPVEGALLTADQFRRQVRFLKARYHLISPETFRDWLTKGASLPPRAVLLTCDDGLRNVLTVMVPILLEECARCLFFVTGGSLEDTARCLWYDELYRMLQAGTANLVSAERWWGQVEALSVLSEQERTKSLDALRMELNLSERKGIVADSRLLNRGELLELVNQGMTIGAHTLSHPLLTKMPAELAEQEIRECKARLEACVQQEIWAFAYPFGHEGSVGVREMEMAEQAGYCCAFTNHGGGRLRGLRPRFAIPRAHVASEMKVSELEAHMTGFHEALQRRFRGAGGAIQACA